jgi:hypothetical protein
MPESYFFMSEIYSNVLKSSKKLIIKEYFEIVDYNVDLTKKTNEISYDSFYNFIKDFY